MIKRYFRLLISFLCFRWRRGRRGWWRRRRWRWWSWRWQFRWGWRWCVFL